MRSKFSNFFSWANHGWPSIGLQGAGGLLILFGIGCVAQVRWGDFLLGPVFSFISLMVGEKYITSAGWVFVSIGLLLFLLTFPAQRRQYTRFRKDQAMLQRQEWRK